MCSWNIFVHKKVMEGIKPNFCMNLGNKKNFIVDRTPRSKCKKNRNNKMIQSGSMVSLMSSLEMLKRQSFQQQIVETKTRFEMSWYCLFFVNTLAILLSLLSPLKPSSRCCRVHRFIWLHFLDLSRV